MKTPEGSTIKIEGNTITVSGAKGSVAKTFNPKNVNVKMEGGELVVTHAGKKLTRASSAAVNAIEAHVKAMGKGVKEGYEKKLTVVYAHFPITVEAKGKEVVIKNFLGEKSLRKAKIVGSTQVKIEKQEITVSGSDKEAVGQTAANIMMAVRITNRDRRVFQDGVYPAAN